MFRVKPEHTRRVSFATKLFPKARSPINLDINKLKPTDGFDGDTFCGGRSTNRHLLTFFGFIKDTNNNCASFVQLPSFRRALKKLTNLVELELETIGAQEVLMPTLVHQKLWDQSKRLERQCDALDNVYKFTDNSGVKVLLGPTFEESVTQMVASESISESELPLLVYQSSQKFRYEPNPRFGLVRTNEFLMNDLYSFDANLEKAKQTYDTISKVYDGIFKRLDLSCVKIQSEPGNIGGKFSHEYQLPVSSGEDIMIRCNDCGHAYNLEMSHGKENRGSCMNCKSDNTSQTKALELAHTFLLSDTYSRPLNAKFTSQDSNRRQFLEMGCYGLGLTRILAAGIDLFSIVPNKICDDETIQLRWPSGVEPYMIGLAPPARRSKQHQAGSSEFIGRVVTRILESTKNIDILIEDRDKEGLIRRIVKLKSIGVPYIITVGQRFLQDQPEVELLKLNSNKDGYDQYWFTENQVIDYISRLDK